MCVVVYLCSLPVRKLGWRGGGSERGRAQLGRGLPVDGPTKLTQVNRQTGRREPTDQQDSTEMTGLFKVRQQDHCII